MKEYRIVKETTTNTNKVKYYVERKNKFLIWEWWTKLKCYDAGYDWNADYTTYIYEDARMLIDKLTDQIVTEVVG